MHYLRTNTYITHNFVLRMPHLYTKHPFHAPNQFHPNNYAHRIPLSCTKKEGDPKVTNMNEQPPLESILTGVLVF